jgi:hypothetical protein
MAAAVSKADHCQTGPLGRCTLADLRGAALLRAFASVLTRPEVFIANFFFDTAFLKPPFLPITVFLATSDLRCDDGTVGVSRPCVERGEVVVRKLAP